MWITGGDHELTENIVHLVLARPPAADPGQGHLAVHRPEVPARRTRNDVALVSLNHKMGNHARRTLC